MNRNTLKCKVKMLDFGAGWYVTDHNGKFIRAYDTHAEAITAARRHTIAIRTLGHPGRIVRFHIPQDVIDLYSAHIDKLATAMERVESIRFRNAHSVL